MTRRTERLLFAAGALLIAIALVINVYIARLENEHLRRDIQTLQSEQPQEGGAETAEFPTPREVESRFTFPIAESDYLELTSPFGYRVSPILGVEMYHQGLDVAATWRAQVVATADGVVVEHWPPPDGYFRGHDVYGGLVVVEHSDGWRSLYAHLSETRVNTGDWVRAGTVLGRVGATGLSRGAHLHFELIDADGQRVNPLLYVSPRGE